MASEDLRVSTAHLQEPASTHDRAASEVTAATDAAAGVDRQVRISHGTVATSTAQALLTLEQARRAAGRDVAAASRYDVTDHRSGGHLNRFPQ
ncbi:ESX-1 secretion-associated protein [Mycobacterium sp. ITM-2017-0098]|nr:ESX-1 secretion-associated protein [Mycobacterium sp. ITM-2017-0098]